MIDPNTATGNAKELLDGIQAKVGMTPNLYRIMANSPAALGGLMDFGGALAKGSLSAKLREQIALVVAETNGCDYCLAAHSAVGKSLGLSKEALLDSRRGSAADTKTRAALAFAGALVENRGHVADEDLQHVRDGGYDDGAIVEIIATVALNTFTNYFNHVAETPVDFPEAVALSTA
jgi:uncharacterized peroxidase-related enzyme